MSDKRRPDVEFLARKQYFSVVQGEISVLLWNYMSEIVDLLNVRRYNVVVHSTQDLRM